MSETNLEIKQKHTDTQTHTHTHTHTHTNAYKNPLIPSVIVNQVS